MKKFLVIGFAIFAFAILLSTTANAQSCRWRNSRSYNVSEYGYSPAYYSRSDRRSYRRYVRKLRKQYRRAYNRRYYAPRRNGVYVSFSYTPSRRYYY